MEKVFYTTNKNETQKIGETLAKLLSVGDVLTLDGDLGAGKTTFTQGLGRGLNVKETINSPTFNILKCYFSGKLPLYHIDAYRLEDKINTQIGLEEVIEGDGVCVIEWSKFIEEMIYNPLQIIIERIDETKRKITFVSDDVRYIDIMNSLEDKLNV